MQRKQNNFNFSSAIARYYWHKDRTNRVLADLIYRGINKINIRYQKCWATAFIVDM